MHFAQFAEPPATAATSHSCLELRFSSWQFRRAVRAGQAFEAVSKEKDGILKGAVKPSWVPSGVLEQSAFA